jgi:cytochrome c oxidase accessory protein FixG
MIISYDPNRGEQRGKLTGKKRKALAEKNLPPQERTLSLDVLQLNGDCIDCHECVVTCPTGIDIRDGLQLECIGCAQCIDACNNIMRKIGRPPGLIRYTSQNAIAGKGKKLLRPRVIIYPALVAVVLTAFLFVLTNQSSADVTLLRNVGQPFVTLDNQRVQNTLRLKIVNRTGAPQTYRAQVVEPALATATLQGQAVTLEPGQSETTPLVLIAPFDLFANGRLDVTVRVTDESGLAELQDVQMKGPFQWPTTRTNGVDAASAPNNPGTNSGTNPATNPGNQP